MALIIDKANDRGCLTERIRMEKEKERGGVREWWWDMMQQLLSVNEA